MDAIETFKNKAAQNVAGYSARKKKKEQDGFDTASSTEVDKYLKRMADETQTVKAQDATNRALQSSRQENVKQDTTAGQALNNQIANVQAAEQARQAQIKAAQQPTTQTTPQGQLSEQARKAYAAEKNSDAWKKYYEEEKQKVRDSAFKNDGFGSWLQDVFNAGWDARLAEQNARNRYASEILNRAFDDDGNVLDKDAVALAQGIAAYNLERSKQINEIERANSRALGASYDSDYKDNPFAATANAIRRMDLGNAILQGDESDASGVGKFLLNLIPGMLNAPTTGFTNVSEALTGQGLDSETGNKRDLDGLERLGRGLSGAIDVAGVFYGGSGEAISSISNQIFKKGATETAKAVAKQTSKQVMKDFVKSMLQEGSEEAVQQAFEFFGDGGKIITKDGEFDGDAFKELAGQVAQAGALGAVGGGIFHGISLGTDAIGSNINNRLAKSRNANTGLNENVNQDTNLNGNYNENLVEDIDEQAKDVRKETKTDITAQEMVNNAAQAQRVVENTDVFRDQLNDAQKQSYNELVKPIREQLEQNKISYDEYLNRIEEIQNTFAEQTEQAQAQQQEESATGQQVNPNEVTAAQDAEGTQAADGVPTETNQVNAEENTTEEVEGTQAVSEAIVTDQTREELGKMTASFLKDHEGKEITAKEWESFAQKLAKKIDAEFAARRKKLEKVAKKLESGRREGATTQAEARLTALERELMGKVQQELNVVRENARTSSAKDIGEGDYGEMYFPNRLKGAGQNIGADYILQGFDQRKPGNEFSRKGKLGLEELDFTSDAIVGYVREYATPDAVRESKIAQQILSEEPDARSEMAAEGAKKIREVQDAVNKASTEGLIKRKTKVDIDVVDKLSEAGKDFGFRQQVVDSKLGRGLTDEQKLTATMMPNGKSAFETYGFLNQQRSPFYAGQQVAQNMQSNNGNIDFNSLAQTVDTTLQEDFNISDNKREKLVNKILGLSADSPREVVFSELQNLYDSAAQSQFYRASMRYQVTDPALKTMLNNHGVNTLRWGTMRKSAAIKVVDSVRRDMNSAYRLLNVSSAINELGDIPSILTAFGKDGFTSLVPRKGILADFGLVDNVNIDPALDAKIMNSTPKEAISKINKIHDKALANYYVEKYKAAVVLTASEKVHLAENMSGNTLTDAVLYDYKNIALPVDQFSKTFLDNYPLLTQYMSWNLRNMQKEGKLLTGNLDAGALGSKSKGQRIAINAFTNIPAKTVWWLASNAMKGTAITAAFGLMDIGMYSDVNDEDRDIIENIAQVLPQSPVSQIIAQCYEIAHRQLLKEQYAERVENGEKTYNPYEDADATAELLNIAKNSFIPGISQINKTVGFLNDQDKGYTENAKGKVKYATDNDLLNNAKGFVFGSNQTDAGREYSGNKSIFQRMNEGRGFLDALTDMAMEDLEMKDRDYQRPANDLYSTAIKMDARENMAADVERARRFNDLSKELKNAYSDAYNNNKDSLGIEYYRELYNNPDALNATIAKKQQLREDMDYFGGIPGFIEAAKNDPELMKYNSAAINDIWNPIWDLPLEDLRSVLEEKATYTGDDIPLRNLNRLKDWYEGFNDEMNEYYATMEKLGAYTEDDGSEMDRAAKWQKLNDKLNTFNIQSDNYQWGSFPLYEQMTELYDKYGENSEEVKAWWKANYDAYQAEKVKKDEQRLDIINAMREIEGTDPMTLADLMRADATGSASDLEDWLDDLLNGRGGGSSSYSYAPEFRNTFNTDPYYLSAQAKKASGFSWDKAKKPSFYAVPTSRSSGKDPYSSVV